MSTLKHLLVLAATCSLVSCQPAGGTPPAAAPAQARGASETCLCCVQATLPVMRLQDAKPHYMWLALHPTAPSKGRSSLDPSVHGATASAPPAPVCELHLRLQWTRDEPEERADTSPSFAVEVGLCGVGVSIVDASSLRLPREVKFVPANLCTHRSPAQLPIVALRSAESCNPHCPYVGAS